MNSWKGKKIQPKKILFFISLGILFCLALGYVVMLLWNWLLPDLFGIKTINWWQAIGLFVLFRILFGGFKGGGRRAAHGQKKKYWKEKWMQMDDAERSQFKSKWKDYCDKKGGNP